MSLMVFRTRMMRKGDERVRVASQVQYLALLARGYTEFTEVPGGMTFDPGRGEGGGDTASHLTIITQDPAHPRPNDDRPVLWYCPSTPQNMADGDVHHVISEVPEA